MNPDLTCLICQSQRRWRNHSGCDDDGRVRWHGEVLRSNGCHGNVYREMHDVGSVGCLKEIKSAISVARKVMEHTEETLLVGDDGECAEVTCNLL